MNVKETSREALTVGFGISLISSVVAWKTKTIEVIPAAFWGFYFGSTWIALDKIKPGKKLFTGSASAVSAALCTKSFLEVSIDTQSVLKFGYHFCCAIVIGLIAKGTLPCLPQNARIA